MFFAVTHAKSFTFLSFYCIFTEVFFISTNFLPNKSNTIPHATDSWDKKTVRAVMREKIKVLETDIDKND